MILDNLGISLGDSNTRMALNYYDRAIKLNQTDYFAMYNKGLDLARAGNM
jgi:hypothetical protein